MRELAKSITKAAAVHAGLAEESVIDVPDRQSLLLPMPRLEMEMMPQDIRRQPRRFARLKSQSPGHVIHRWRTHSLSLQVRTEIRADNEVWLEDFFQKYIKALPGKAADEEGNLVTVSPERAERGGFEHKMIEVFQRRSIPVWISFNGGLYRDEQVPLIVDVNIKDGVSLK